MKHLLFGLVYVFKTKVSAHLIGSKGFTTSEIVNLKSIWKETFDDIDSFSEKNLNSLI